jgi:NTE family protein
MKKTAIILSGGGFRGAFQFGALKYLNEIGIKPDLVAGVSVGALNGSFIAANKFKELNEIWEGVQKNGSSEIFDSKYVDLDNNMALKIKKIYKYFFKEQSVFSLLTKGGRARLTNTWNSFSALSTCEPMAEKLKSISLEDIKVPFSCGATSLNDGKFNYKFNFDFSSNNQFRKFIEASATMPIICPPVKKVITKNNTMTNLVDGGVRCIVPISQVIEHIKNSKEDWELIIINCSTGELTPTENINNIGKIGLRSLNDIALSQIFINNLKTTEIINKFVKASGRKILNGYKYYPLKIISPSGLDIGDTLDSNSEIIKYRIEQGYKTAKKLWN